MEEGYDINQFNAIVQNRRSIYPYQFIKGKPIPDDVIRQILENANRAPTHKLTQPWRFTVFSGKGREAFSNMQTEIYTKYAGENFKKKKLQNLRDYPLFSSHVIVVSMKRTLNISIPEIEEIIAVGCAIENIFLSLHAYNLGGYITTGRITYIDEAKPFFDLDPQDRLIGTIFIGYPDVVANPLTRRSPVDEKVRWISDSFL